MLSSRSLKIVALGCALFLAGCDRQSREAAQPQPSAAAPSAPGTIDLSHKGSELPDFLLKDESGKEAMLASFKGKPLLINLWATWCAPCVVELPQLDRLAQAHPGIKVLVVNQDFDKLEKIAPFLKDKGGTRLEPWIDPQNTLMQHYDAQVLPATVYYDASGRELWRIIGPRDWSDAETKALLAEGQ